jgi:hypothetical protein
MPGRRGKQRVKKNKSKKQVSTPMERTVTDSIFDRNRTEKSILTPMLPPRPVAVKPARGLMNRSKGAAGIAAPEVVDANTAAVSLSVHKLPNANENVFVSKKRARRLLKAKIDAEREEFDNSDADDATAEDAAAAPKKRDPLDMARSMLSSIATAGASKATAAATATRGATTQQLVLQSPAAAALAVLKGLLPTAPVPSAAVQVAATTADAAPAAAPSPKAKAKATAAESDDTAAAVVVAAPATAPTPAKKSGASSVVATPATAPSASSSTAATPKTSVVGKAVAAAVTPKKPVDAKRDSATPSAAVKKQAATPVKAAAAALASPKKPAWKF